MSDPVKKIIIEDEAGIEDGDLDMDWPENEEWCETCNNIGEIPYKCGGDLRVFMNRGSMPCPDCDRFW